MSADPIGPILQAVLRALWNKLWDNTPGNELYLPNIIKNGSTKLGLPAYDPAHEAGVSQPFAISNVPSDVINSACTRDVPISPIANGSPNLRLSNIRLAGLSVVSPVTFDFSTTEPTISAVVSVGTSADTDKAFVMSAWDAGTPNYFFDVGCCEPVSIGSNQCSSNTWVANASGNFKAIAYDVKVTLNIQLNTPANAPPSVTVLSIKVAADPKKINLDFDVKNLPQWAQQMAQIAVQQGVGDGSIISAFQSFLNSAEVKGDIEKLLNDQLAKIP